MKIVLNKCYGGYRLSPELIKATGLDAFDDSIEARTNEKLIAYIEEHPDFENSNHSRLEIFNTPDNTTDFLIEEYDGLETLYFVVNGKLYFA